MMSDPSNPDEVDRLELMLRTQRSAAARVQVDPLRIDTDVERIQYFKDMVLAATDELHEALGEVGWKPWATSRHINVDAAFGELRDAWQFLMNAMMVITQEEPDVLARHLLVAHTEKVAKNLERAAMPGGYDGVSDKCPQCRRSFADMELKQVPRYDSVLPRVDIHCVCGHRITSRPMSPR